MTKFWFIRHGESVSNANLPTEDPTLSELTPRGQIEAKSVALAFSEAPDLIVVSSFVRARETAVPTINRFPNVPVIEWPVHEFIYLHPERYRGTTGSERAPLAQAFWQRNDPYENENGGGESFSRLLNRVVEIKSRLHECPENFVAVFSHGLFLRALIWSILSGIEEPTPETMTRYHRFVAGLWMKNGAIFEGLCNKNGRVHISGFDTSHIPTITAR